MIKALRYVAGVLLTALLFYAADLAVRDCTSGLYTYDNCLSMWLREHFGLPQGKLWRAAALEVVGLSLLAGLYLTIRYVFPPLSRRNVNQHP